MKGIVTWGFPNSNPKPPGPKLVGWHHLLLDRSFSTQPILGVDLPLLLGWVHRNNGTNVKLYGHSKWTQLNSPFSTGINLLNNVFRLPLYTISDRVTRLQWKLYLNVPAQRISREGGYLDMIFQHEEKNTFGCSQISQSLLQRVMTSMDHNVGDAGDFFSGKGRQLSVIFWTFKMRIQGLKIQVSTWVHCISMCVICIVPKISGLFTLLWHMIWCDDHPTYRSTVSSNPF